MAALPVMAELTPSGSAVAAQPSKRPLYAVRELTETTQPPQRIAFRRPGKAPARPGHVLFGATVHPKIRVLKPMPVDISRRSDGYVAQFKQVAEFGCGDTLSSALDDLGKTIAELFLTLTEQRQSLGPDMKRVHANLSRYVALREK